MKTLNLKETFAWIALVCAIALFTFTVSFAQVKKSGTVHIQIQKEMNGKTEKIDKTYTFSEDSESGSVATPVRIGNPPKEIPIQFPDPIPNPDPIPTPNFFYDTMLFRPDYSERRSVEMELIIEEEITGLPGTLSTIDLEWNDADMSEYISIQFNDKDHIILSGLNAEASQVFEKEVEMTGHKIFIYKGNIQKNISESREAGNEDPVAEAIQEANLEIYPNPGNGQFNVSFLTANQGALKLRITDINGRELYRQMSPGFAGNFNQSIDLKDAGKGIYILSVEQDNKQFTKRIVII